MEKILEGDNDTFQTLRAQLGAAAVAQRRMTGVGFFLHFAVPEEAPRLPGSPELIVSNDMRAEIDGLANGAGFVLWVADGAIDQLEGYCFGETWPEKVTGFKLNVRHASQIAHRKSKG